ncbi:T9SS type A sorting domain-containing protein [Psychroserpens mesophilus]|uniref:T9SS type A sorting domain-containing protein n=1 Tax=Psychroserpens mesophilus TaxID=325473 RepID=UPI0005902D9D|nr:T9SS type A sorting domain-containing protein [Psychroserpens mesophilus]
MKTKLLFFVTLIISAVSHGQIFDESFDDPFSSLPPFWDFSIDAFYSVQNEELVVDAYNGVAEVISPAFDSTPFDSIEVEFVVNSPSALQVEIYYLDVASNTNVLAYSTFTNASGPETIMYEIDPPGSFLNIDVITLRFSDFIPFQMVLDDIVITGIGGSAGPVTYTFTSGSWTPSNPSGLATASDDIVIADGNAIFNTLTTANTVTIEAGASLTIDAGLTASQITLNSISTSFASLVPNVSASITGNVIYQRFVNSNILGNDLISPPLSGQTWASFIDPVNATALLSNAGAPTVYAFAPFDKTTGDFENYDLNSSAILTSGTGYRVATNTGEILAFSGTVAQTPVSVNIVDSGSQYTEWNLIGNPYPSYLDIQSFLNHPVDTGVLNLDLFVDQSAAIYAYNGNGYNIINLSNVSTTPLMAPGQGFFVAAKASNVGAYDLEFTPSMQTNGASDDFIAGRNAELIYLKLGLSSSFNNYNTEFYFNENSSEGLDKGYDAALWGATAPEFSIYSHLVQDNTGKPIGLQTLNPSDLSNVSIPLGVNASQGEQITFAIIDSSLPASVNVYLDDDVANTSTLLNTGDYVITPATALSGTGRFFLRTTEDALSTISNNSEVLNIFALNSSKELVVSGQISDATILNLYDIQGRKVLSIILDATILNNRVDVSGLSGGIYVVNISNGSKQLSQKVIIK